VLFLGCQKSDDSTPANSPRESVISKIIHFDASGESEPYRVLGWSKTEEKFTWSEGSLAKLSLPIPKNPGPLVLKVAMAALIREPDRPFQPVEGYANGCKIAEWKIGNTAKFAAPIPGELSKGGGELAVEIRIPKATSPKALGQNEDTRVLGVCVHWIEVAKSG
jgi:hypothetical protein